METQEQLLDVENKPVKRMHTNSIEAYYEEAPKLSKRAITILEWFRNRGMSRTDRECKDELFGSSADMNMVRPRITELIELGFLEETGSTTDPITGKRVRFTRARQV